MLQYSKFLDNRGILGIMRRTCNCVDSRLLDHGFRVSYLVSGILEKTGGYSMEEKRDICILALLHDIGAYKTEEISSMLSFDTGDVLGHSVYGYLFIKHFTPLRKMAKAILFHHTPWEHLSQMDNVEADVLKLAQIINIADRVDIFLMQKGEHSEAELSAWLEKGRGKRFMPELADAMQKVIDEGWSGSDFEKNTDFQGMLWETPFTEKEIQEYLGMIIYTIDFRSNHTVNHTITTTSISYELAQLCGLTEQGTECVICGALLHDLGKIAVPVEILEFPGKLSPQAMQVMRKHVELTGEILGDAVSEQVRRIALRHHEKLNGSGYPEGLDEKELSTEERIVAVADIVSALAGTRSYKEAYAGERVVRIIEASAKAGLIDGDIVARMVEHYDEIMARTALRCKPAIDAYRSIKEEYKDLMVQYRQ